MKNIFIIPTDKPSRLRYFDSKLEIMSLIPKKSDIVFQNIYITNLEEIKEGDWFIYKDEVIHRDKGKIDSMWVDAVKNGKKIILTTDPDLIADGVQAIDDEFLEWFVQNPSCESVEVEKYHGIKTSIAEISAVSGNDDYNWKGLGDFRDYKIIIPQEEPKLYPIGGYAPGHYTCTCVSCKTRFQGDKRAVQCEPCAIEMVKLKIKTNDNGGIQIDKQETLEEAAEKYGWRIKKNTFSDRVKANELADSAKQDFISGAKWQAERNNIESISFGKWLLIQDITSRGEGVYVDSKGDLLTVEQLFERFKISN